MRTIHSLNEIRYALETEIAGALSESFFSTRVEISETSSEEEVYSVKGTFKVIPFLSSVVKRKGKFDAKLDQNLRILSIKLTEDT